MAVEPPERGRPSPKECFFCLAAASSGRWTCPAHRSFEAFALTYAVGVLGSWPGRSALSTRAWADSVMDWNSAPQAQPYKSAAERYWPPTVKTPDKFRLRALCLGLTTELVEHGLLTGSLPNLDALRLATEERSEILHCELTRRQRNAELTRTALTVGARDATSAIYQLTDRRGKQMTVVKLTVSDLGTVAAVELPPPCL